jgi:hypothetical protein
MTLLEFDDLMGWKESQLDLRGCCMRRGGLSLNRSTLAAMYRGLLTIHLFLIHQVISRAFQREYLKARRLGRARNGMTK